MIVKLVWLKSLAHVVVDYDCLSLGLLHARDLR